MAISPSKIVTAGTPILTRNPLTAAVGGRERDVVSFALTNSTTTTKSGGEMHAEDALCIFSRSSCRDRSGTTVASLNMTDAPSTCLIVVALAATQATNRPPAISPRNIDAQRSRSGTLRDALSRSVPCTAGLGRGFTVRLQRPVPKQRFDTLVPHGGDLKSSNEEVQCSL